MNRYVNQQIAFCYPDDLRCTHHLSPSQFHLRRGTLHIFLEQPGRKDWERRFNEIGSGPAIPTHEHWFEEYDRHGFQGRAQTTLVRKPSGEIVTKGVNLVLRRGQWRIWLQISDQKDFSLDCLDLILETLAFPGESAQAEFQRLGPIKKQTRSPFVVSLKHFSKFGRKARKGRARYDVEYRGDPPSDQQLQAVEQFLENEEGLYQEASRAIFRYYTEFVFPFMKQHAKHIAECDELWPHCRTVEGTMPLVELASLMVHEPREDGAIAIGLRFDCSWNEEDGLGLRAVGSTIEAIGTDFVALDSRFEEWPAYRQTPGGEKA